VAVHKEKLCSDNLHLKWFFFPKENATPDYSFEEELLEIQKICGGETENYYYSSNCVPCEHCDRDHRHEKTSKML
jgi:hypothetical protein